MASPAEAVLARETTLAVAEFRDVLVRSGLGERRPVDRPERLAAMIAGANLIVTAREAVSGRLVGVARSLSDFAFCTYLSDLAVDPDWQGRGIGRALIERTRTEGGAWCAMVLISAPKAIGFYEQAGLPRFPAFGIERDDAAWPG